MGLCYHMGECQLLCYSIFHSTKMFNIISDHVRHLHLPLSIRIFSDGTCPLRDRVTGAPLRAAAVLPVLRHHLAAVHRCNRSVA